MKLLDIMFNWKTSLNKYHVLFQDRILRSGLFIYLFILIFYQGDLIHIRVDKITNLDEKSKICFTTFAFFHIKIATHICGNSQA